MEALRAAVEAQLGESWSGAVDWLRENNQVDDIARRMRLGDIDGAVQGVEQAAMRVAADIHSAFVQSAEATAEWVDGQIATKLVTFDTTNQRAAEWARMNRADAVREMSIEVKDSISKAVARNVREGRNPMETAREIRDSIGLTEHQDAVVANYRRALEDGDFGHALKAKLRDKRSDKVLRRLEKSGDSMTGDQIDSLVERYRKGWIKHRSEVIAQTEGLRALHEGNEEMLEQAIDSGSFERDDLIREWNTSGHANVRDSHQYMDGQTRLYGETFRSGKGNPLAYPGDPSAPGSEIIHCHCVLSTRIRTPEEDAKLVKAPKGFDAEGRTIIDGLPARAEIDPEAVYSVRMSDIHDDLIATPGGGENQARLQRIRDGVAGGYKFAPVDVAMLDDGRLFVSEGRHRLTVIDEQGGRVLIRLSKASDGADSNTVPLFDD